MDNQDHLVKVSVFLPAPVHLQLKRSSLERRTSLQKVIADMAVAATQNAETNPPAEPLDSMALVLGPGGAQEKIPEGTITQSTVKQWQHRLGRLLESRDRLVILNATATIEAMEELLKERKSHSSVASGTNSSTLNNTIRTEL